MKSQLYEPRTYRTMCQAHDLVNLHVMIKESDLLIRSRRDVSQIAATTLAFLRQQIEDYIAFDPSFLYALAPIKTMDAPAIVRKMSAAASIFGVGPMAAVAGAISEQVAHFLSAYSEDIIVENGGDIFIKNEQNIILAIHNRNTEDLLVEITPHARGIAVCTSSSTFGHSLSFGQAHSVTVMSPSAYHADAAATALCNAIQSSEDISKAIAIARDHETITGLIIAVEDKIGFFGEEVKLV